MEQQSTKVGQPKLKLIINKRIDISMIDELYSIYPPDFVEFCKENNLKCPSINSSNGKALAAMLHNIGCYWERDSCDDFVKKFNISSKDSIQLFNKHEQWGISTNSGKEKGKYYIEFPYKLSNKHKMRKNFKFNGSEEEKNVEIDKIKSTLMADYIDVPNNQWQLGHKNPGSEDSSYVNLVLQPPIQGKYRDSYVFVDTVTKFPLAPKLKSMIAHNQINFTKEQIQEYLTLFTELKTNMV